VARLTWHRAIGGGVTATARVPSLSGAFAGGPGWGTGPPARRRPLTADYGYQAQSRYSIRSSAQLTPRPHRRAQRAWECRPLPSCDSWPGPFELRGPIGCYFVWDPPPWPQRRSSSWRAGRRRAPPPGLRHRSSRSECPFGPLASRVALTTSSTATTSRLARTVPASRSSTPVPVPARSWTGYFAARIDTALLAEVGGPVRYQPRGGRHLRPDEVRLTADKGLLTLVY